MNRITSLPRTLWRYATNHVRKTIVIVLAITAVVVGISMGGDTAEAPQSDVRIPNVSLASVAALSADVEPLILLGEVRSVSQAELRAQKSGEVTQVYTKAGAYVPAGAILAEIDNASERAAVLSAQGVLAAAEAQLAKVRAGDRSEDKASTLAQADASLVTLQTARDSARSAYSQSYSLAQDAVVAQADDFFTNTYTVNPSFRVRTADYNERQVLEAERVALGTVLATWGENTRTAISEDLLDVRLAEAQRDLERIKRYLNQISTFVSEQEVDGDLTSVQKAAQEATILGARANVDSARSAVNGARTGLANARAGATVASLNESKSVTGARPEDIAAAEAGVTQARGGLASARAALEKSLIRSPIAGTVSTLSVTRGDYAAAMSVVAVVANDAALEIELFVSDNARARIEVGLPVVVAGTYSGTVTSAAPGLDPQTKKARVTVALTEDAPLVNGAFVEVAVIDGDSAPEDVSELMIPVAAIKVLPRGLAVFTVSDTGVLVAHPITEGPIIGSRMRVSDGVTPDMRIVRDVRGLSEGDEVQVLEEGAPVSDTPIS